MRERSDGMGMARHGGRGCRSGAPGLPAGRRYGGPGPQQCDGPAGAGSEAQEASATACGADVSGSRRGPGGPLLRGRAQQAQGAAVLWPLGTVSLRVVYAVP